MLTNSNANNYYSNMDSRYNDKGTNATQQYNKANNGYYTNSRSSSRTHSPNTLLQAAHSPDSIAMQHNDYHHSKPLNAHNKQNHHRRSNSKHDTCTCLQCIEKEYEEAVKFQQQAARKIYTYVEKKQQQELDSTNDEEQDEEDDDSFSESYDEELGMSDASDYYASSVLEQEAAQAQAQAQAAALHIQQQAKLQAEYYRKQQEIQQQQYLQHQQRALQQHQQQLYQQHQHARSSTAQQASHSYVSLPLNKALDLPQNRTASQPAASTVTGTATKPGIRITIHEEAVDNMVRAAEVPAVQAAAAAKVPIVKAEPVKFKWSKRHILRSMSSQNTNHNIRHWSTFPAPTTRIFNRVEVAQCIKAFRPKSAPNSRPASRPNSRPNSRKTTPSSTPKSTSRSITTKSPPSNNVANVAHHYNDENVSASDWNAKKSRPINNNVKEQQWERESQQGVANAAASKLAAQRSNSAHHLPTKSVAQQQLQQQQQATRRSASTSHLPVNGTVLSQQQLHHQSQQVVPAKSSHYYSSMAPGMSVATAAVKTMQMNMAINGASTGSATVKPSSRPASATRQATVSVAGVAVPARVMKAYGQLPKL